MGNEAAEPAVAAPAVAGGGAPPRLFVVHAPEDAWFVEGFLLASLKLPAADVVVASAVGDGAVGDVERGARAALAVVVVSPAFLSAAWARFAHHVAAFEVSEGRAALIPALLAECELPLVLRSRVALDFRKPERELWEGQVARLRKTLDAPPPPVVAVPCPYPGIRPFTAEDAARFYGRGQEVSELLGRLRDGQRELYIIGPSGSGKSSLVEAGLIPRLVGAPDPAERPAGGRFAVAKLRPGADPIAALAAALAAPAGGSPDDPAWLAAGVGRVLAARPGRDRLVVFVDQLEELFTTAPAAARAAFVAAVRGLRGDARVALLFALRADFYAQLMESALWTDLHGQLARLDVGPLRGEALREAIEAPARALGVYLEPVLVERLLGDVADEPGALPLLQDTLVELWQHRVRGLVRLAEYEAMSDGARTGLAVTVARRADAALAELAPGRRDIARRVLLRLVQFGDGAATTRRQQPRAQLATAGDAPDEIDAVVRHLADRRLVTTSGGGDGDPSARIDLAHEILLTAWPALGDWIRTRRQDEQRRRALQDRAAEWARHGRGASRLLDGDELHEVRGWLTDDVARDLGISEEIHSLIARSAAALDAAAAELEARRRRWRRWVAGALAGLTVAVVAVSTLAVIASRRSREAREQAAVAERQAERAEVQTREARRQLARNYAAQGQALVMNDLPAQAVPYLLAAREAGIDDVPLHTLFRRAAIGVPLVEARHDARLETAALSPDGTRIATAQGDGQDNAARIWDTATGRLVATLRHAANVNAVVWSPDGKRIATASNDRTARVWDPETGQAVTPPLAHENTVDKVRWSADGSRIATLSFLAARIWDAATGRPVTPSLDHRLRLQVIAWSPDGTRLATGSADGAHIWDAATGRDATPRLEHDSGVGTLAWSPDGARLATGSSDRTARIWDGATGRAVGPALAHRSTVSAVAWSPDGKRLATASDDGAARVWQATGEPVTPSIKHQGAVIALAWSPDGTRLATRSEEFSVRLWDAETGDPVGPPLVHRDIVHAMAWSRDGRRIATASRDDTARIWDAATCQPITPPMAHPSEVLMLAWLPDGARIATASRDGSARVWDARSQPAVVLGHRAEVRAAAWSPDGTRVVTAGNDHVAQIWDARGEPVTPPLEHDAEVIAAAWSPDGTRVVTACGKTARIWDARTGAAVPPALEDEAKIKTVAWSPDGARIAIASDDDAIRVWDARSGEALDDGRPRGSSTGPMAWSPDGRRLAGATYNHVVLRDTQSGERVMDPLVQGDFVWAIAWSPDSTRLATGERSGAVHVLDAATGRSVATMAHPSPIESLAWSPDGKRLATSSGDSTARVWDAASGKAVSRALVHDYAVSAVAWSPDGTRVATASWDGTARVWDPDTGQPVTPLLRHESPFDNSVQLAAWSPDGTRLLTAGNDGTARIWDVAPDTSGLADWRAVVERSDYRLNDDGVLVGRKALAAPPAPAR